MSKKFPSQVRFDPDEIQRINRIRMAKWLGVTPAEIDQLTDADHNDVMQIMWADAQK